MIKCFVSYSHDDMDQNALEYMLNMIAHFSEGQIDFIIDKDIEYGRDFDDFMSLLDSVDGVIVLYTPTYKQKILNRQRGGVYTEWNVIVARYHEGITSKLKNDYLNNNLFHFIPMLFSGNHESSVPSDLEKCYYDKLTQFRVHKKTSGQIYLPSSLHNKFHPIFQKIASKLTTQKTYSSESFIKTQKEWHKKLFGVLKADWINLSEEERHHQGYIFVKTHIYIKVKNRERCILIGRKGSGKSTVVKFIPYLEKGKYKYHEPIIVDNLELEFIYTLAEEPQASSEFQSIFSLTKALRFSWELYIHLYCMYSIANEYKNGSIKPDRLNDAKKVKDFVANVLQDEDFTSFSATSAPFVFSLQQVKLFMDHCIESAREDKNFFYNDIIGKFKPDNFLSFACGHDTLQSFNNIITKCEKRILFSLDGFDAAFDKYRSNSVYLYRLYPEVAYSRTQFEINWLQELLFTVLRIQSGHENKKLYSLIDFCITVPLDRFLELRKLRDSYIYSGQYSYLQWTAIELVIMLRKRLEVASNIYPSKDNKSPIDRLDKILALSHDNLTTTTSTQICSNTYYHHLFIDVLRHTFWRPREILWYFRNIISVAIEYKEKRKKVTNETIRKIISDTTLRVIENEFISEYKNHCLNLLEVLNKFQGISNFISFQDISEILSNIHFNLINLAKPLDSLPDKILFLYDIGLIGIDATEEQVRRLGLKYHHCFFFNEKISISNIKEGIENLSFIIHPLFYEYLNIDVACDLVLNYNWEYLADNESYAFAAIR